MTGTLLVALRACDCGVHCKSGCIQEKAADEIERLQAMLMKIAKHPDTPELIKQYAAGKLDRP